MPSVKIIEITNNVTVTYDDGSVKVFVPQGSEVSPVPPTVTLPIGTPIIVQAA